MGLFGTQATVLEGWAVSVGGDAQAGIARIRTGIEGWASSASHLWQAYPRFLLADACATAGRIDAGLSAIGKARTLALRHGFRWILAELSRLEGDLLAASCGADAAESCYRKALETARSQGARLWELRAAMGLARLLGGLGRGQEARRHLREDLRDLPEDSGNPDVPAAGELCQTLE